MSLPPPPPLAITELGHNTNDVADLLANWPLYRPLKLQGDFLAAGILRFNWPETLTLFCGRDECQKKQVWARTSERAFVPFTGPASEFHQVFYGCRNCRLSRVNYFVLLHIDKTRVEITKVGQWPPLSRDPDAVVVASWSDNDKLLYRDALTFRNSNKGIGALPYLRRIIETHLRDVLTLIADAHTRKPIDGFDPVKCEKVQGSHNFSEKLDFAKAFLPADLVPAGTPNPIGTLYELISEGIHEKTESECVDVFDRCKAAFEFVVKKLTEAKREDEAYIAAIRKLNKP
jgi:hypothetical protein